MGDVQTARRLHGCVREAKAFCSDEANAMPNSSLTCLLVEVGVQWIGMDSRGNILV